ncbi:MAG: restriction endonuclease subunit S [Bacteroidetes bacterium]|nr:restriction endonuclease subunit S [Bacteroidota bacterium]
MSKIEKHKIGSYIEQATGFPFESSKFNQEQNGIRLLRGINITRGRLRFDSDNEMYYDDREADFSKFHLAENDIVISMDGSLVGRNYAMVNSEFLPLLLVQRVARIRANGTNLDQNYLYQFISSDYFIKYVDSVKTSSGIPHISSKQINEFEVPFFPVEEQKGIAEILSTYDGAIDKLSKLIVSKEKQKKGLMQNLLTGKVRFKEFNKDKWREFPLSDAAWYQEGPGLRTWQFAKSGIKVINITNIVDGVLDLSKTDRHISLEEFNKTYKHFEIQAGDIVIASSGNSYCKHGVVRECDLPLVMNTSVIRFKPLENCDYKYLNQFLKSPFLKSQIDILITGGAQPNFGPAHLAEITIPLPSIEEQQKIAQALKSADDEVSNLKTQLENTKLQKRGLMQQLLTGKIRVK